MAKKTGKSSRVLVLGAGKVGKSVAELLLAAGEGAYAVTLADRDARALEEAGGNIERMRGHVGHETPFEAVRLNVSQAARVREALRGHDAVVCMLPFNFVEGIAQAAAAEGVHYFDVTEDVETTGKVRALDAGGGSPVALAPQCGLAPGYIAIAAQHVASGFDRIDELVLRVGALPQYPTNALRYNLTWSTAGVVNEYCEPCNVMLRGRPASVPALDGLETFSFEGVGYEAFYTSGGVGSLVETLVSAGKTGPDTTIAYKTIRYPGHRDLMKFLLDDLRFGVEHNPASVTVRQWSPPPAAGGAGKGGKPARPGVEENKVRVDRSLLVSILDHSLPRTLQDVVVIFVSCVGVTGGRRHQVNLKLAIRARELWGRVWPAIELTTSAGVCAMVDLHRRGSLPQRGFIAQESVSLADFQGNPFGRFYE
jgi:saccharopine dehydrogenase-like NADP-dependent oxidoreductase